MLKSRKDTEEEGRFKSRGIKCKECEVFGSIQAECANTKKKIRSCTATWSDDKSEEGDEHHNELIAFIVVSQNSAEVTQINESSEHVPNQVWTLDGTHTSKGQICWVTDQEEDDITDIEPSRSYKLLYKTWMDTVKINKAIQRLMSQLNKENDELLKKVNDL